MEIRNEIGPDGKIYQVCNGTWYHKWTNNKVIDWLETFRERKARIRLYYGDIETGLDWGDTHDVTGTIGRSMGPIKIPLLIPTARSFGGGGILDHCIVKIDYSNKKARSKHGAPYQHPKYHTKEQQP